MKPSPKVKPEQAPSIQGAIRKNSISKGRESGSPAGNGKMNRAINACNRCRTRKIKCDRAFPSCASCNKAGATCVGIDAVTGRAVPRSYVTHLEDRISDLEAQLKRYNNGESDKESDNAVESGSSIGESPTSLSSVGDSVLSKNRARNKSDVDNLMERVEMVSVKGSSSQQTSVLGASSGLSFARILFTAVKLQNHDVTANSGAKNFNSHRKVKPARLPAKKIAEEFLDSFFAQANAQLPVIHREEFLLKYWQPIYGKLSAKTSLASDYTKVGTQTSDDDDLDKDCYYFKHCVHQYGDAEDSEELLGEPSKSLYFINIIFGIATSIHQQQYPAHISESYRISAAHHFDAVFSSSNRLEALQGMLLLCLYSVMRPAVPGVWYVLGTALRICLDLGLHQEDVSHSRWLSEGDQKEYDVQTMDMRRRLFWCTYALDRQVCVYLGRPFGIPEESIKVRFPSLLDDADIFQMRPEDKLDGRGMSLEPGPSYKNVALSFFRIRQIQAQIQRILYDAAELPRRFANLDEWTSFMCARLDEWRDQCPKTPEEMNCNFNLAFFELNYYQTQLLIHGLSPINTTTKPHAFFILAEAGLRIITIYSELHRKKIINYTWVAVHNLFMAGTSYLYALYHSRLVRSKTSIKDIEVACRACLNVLSSLQDRCDAAVGCKDSFKMLAAAIIKLCHDERAGNSTVEMEVFPPGVELEKSQSSYVHPHISNLLNSIPGGSLQAEVKADKKMIAPAQQHHPRAQEPEQEPDGDGKMEVELWPQDIDVFFEEAAQLETVSPDSMMNGKSPIASWHEMYFQQPQGSSSTPSPKAGTFSQPNVTQKEGKKIYTMMNDIPMTSIWDQYFAPVPSPGSNTNHPW